MSGLSSALLLAVGLQRRNIEDLAHELNMPLHQAHTLLCKAVRAMVQSLRAVERRAAEADVDATRAEPALLTPVAENLEAELAEAGRQAVPVDASRAALSQELMNDAEMSQYAMSQDQEVWEEAEARVRKMKSDTSGRPYSSTFSVKTSHPAPAPPSHPRASRASTKRRRT